MQRWLFLVLSWLFNFTHLTAQENFKLVVTTSGTNASFRGMSTPAPDIVWVSGSNGTVGKSVDGGKTWRWTVVPGFEKNDFRDIEAFDSSTAIIMAIGDPAYLVKTEDGGNNWRVVFQKSAPGMFLDAMHFRNEKEGICVGDPLTIEDSTSRFFYILRTYDGGNTWSSSTDSKRFRPQPGEAIFSASGTNISFLDDPGFEYGFVSGGSASHLFLAGRPGRRDRKITIPIIQGTPTTGTFSLAAGKKNTMYCIGGDYKAPESKTRNFTYTNRNGVTWSTSLVPPAGYRSCITRVYKKALITCGPTGIDFTVDPAAVWKQISKEGFNVCVVSNENYILFAGDKGRIGILSYLIEK